MMSQTIERKHSRWKLWAASGAALAVVVVAAVVWFAAGQKFWTDGKSLRVSDRDARLRQVVWAPPVELEGFDSDQQVYEPSLSPDGTELYFVRGKAGKNAAILVSLRRNNAWTKPEPVKAVNGPFDALGPRVTSDGKFLLFYSDRPGGLGGYDIWASPRSEAGWGEPFNLGPGVNSEFNEFNPDPTPDGRHLVFATNRAAARREQNEAWRSTIRETVSSDYDLWIADVDLTAGRQTTPTSAPSAATSPSPGTPGEGRGGGLAVWSASADAILPTIASSRLGATPSAEADPTKTMPNAGKPPPQPSPGVPGEGANAPRAEAFQRLTFHNAREIPGVNTPFSEGASCMSPAGDFLYFSSDRPGGQGKFDIYRCRMHGDEFGPVENIGPAINTAGNEADPALAYNGFRMIFSSDRPGADGRYHLLASDSREVYPERQVHALPHLGLSWWLLLLSALVLVPLLMYLRGWEDHRLNILQKCLLLSLLVHALVTFVLSFVVVTQKITQYVRNEIKMEVPIQLRQDHGLEEAIAIRSQSIGDVPVSAAPSPMVTAPRAEPAGQAESVALPPDARVSAGGMTGMVIPVPVKNPSIVSAPANPAEVKATAEIDSSVQLKLPAVARLTQDERIPEARSMSPALEIPQFTRSAEAAPQHLESPGRMADRPARPTAELAAAVEPRSAPVVAAPGAAVNRAVESVAELSVAAPQMPLPKVAGIETPAAVGTENSVLAQADPSRSALGSVAPTGVATQMAKADVARGGLRDAGFVGTVSRPVSVVARPQLAVDEPSQSSSSIETHVPAGRPMERLAAQPASTVAADVATRVDASVAGEKVASASPDEGIQIAAGPVTNSVGPSAIPLVAAHSATRSPHELNAAGSSPVHPIEPGVADSGPAIRARTPSVAIARAQAAEASMNPTQLASMATTQPAGEALAAAGAAHPVELASAISPPSRLVSTMVAAPAAHVGALHAIANAFPKPAASASDLASSSEGDISASPSLARRSAVAVAPEKSVAAGTASPAGAIPAAGATDRDLPGRVEVGPVASAPVLASSRLPRAKRGSHDGGQLIQFSHPQAIASGAEIAPQVSLTPLDGSLGPGELTAPDSPFMRSPEQRKPLIEQLGGTQQSEDAVAMGLSYLAKMQEEDGRWTRVEGDRQRGRHNKVAHDMACTGFAVLAFLGQDHRPDRPGPYRDVVANAIDFLIDQQDERGDLRGVKHLRGGGSDSSNMYDQGIATYALAECGIMTHDPRVIEAANRGAKFIVAAQDNGSGGWRYAPGEAGDSSVFGWQIMALHSAEQVGFAIPEKTLDGAKRYIKSCEEGEHHLLAGYQPHNGPTPPMTAELLFSRMLLDMPLEDEGIDEAVKFLSSQPPGSNDADLYYWYYASLSMLNMQHLKWKDWNTRTREALIHMQKKSGPSAGCWETNFKWGDRGGRIFTTSMAVLTLEVYYRYLPLRADRAAAKEQ
jgi:hypothetical protein